MAKHFDQKKKEMAKHDREEKVNDIYHSPITFIIYLSFIYLSGSQLDIRCL